ncbi:MAG: hypothetical protein Q9186_003013 [Xanthomendoza sp. 1 TL-2023]
MTTHPWPTPPNLDGRPLDTAVLLNRDYQLQIHNHLSNPIDNEIGVPAQVFLAFANSTERVINALCDHGKVQRTAVGSVLETQTVAGTAAAQWPQTPELQGRPLDTALLLHRDHTQQISHRLQHHPDDVFGGGHPVDVWCSFSKNVETLIKALCQHGNIKLNSLDSIPKIKSTAVRPRQSGGETSREAVQPARAPRHRHTTVKVEEPSRSETSESSPDGDPETIENAPNGVAPVEVKHENNMVDRNEESTDTAVNGETNDASEDENSSEDADSDMEAGTDASDNSTASSSTAPPPPLHDAFRKNREVNIRYVDQEKVEHLTRTQLRKHLQSSIRDQNLTVIVDTCSRFRNSGDIRLWTTDVKGARILRDPKKWNVNINNAHGFGPKARVRPAIA